MIPGYKTKSRIPDWGYFIHAQFYKQLLFVMNYIYYIPNETYIINLQSTQTNFTETVIMLMTSLHRSFTFSAIFSRWSEIRVNSRKKNIKPIKNLQIRKF